MTKHSYLKQEIRARMAITGESYSAAARAIAKEEASSPSKGSAFHAPQERAELRSLVIFTERLAVLLSGAITMRAAFEISEQTTEDPVLKRGIQEVLTEHDAGKPMEEAIADRPWAFPGIFSAVISNGIRNGSFYDSMKQMAQLYRTEMELEVPRSTEPLRDFTPQVTTPKSVTPVRIVRDVFDWDRGDLRPLALYVGPLEDGRRIADIKREWKFQHVPTLKDLHWGMGQYTIDRSEVCAIIVSELLYSSEEKIRLFERLAGELASEALFAVDSSDESIRPVIETGVAKTTAKNNRPQNEIFFIDRCNSPEDLDTAVDRFILSEQPNAKNAIWELRNARDTMGSSTAAAKARLNARIRAEEKGLLRLEQASTNSRARAEAERFQRIQNDPFDWRDTDTRPLAVYIGLKEVGAALARVQNDWRFIHRDSPEAFFASLQDGTIDSSEVSSILILDKFYSIGKSGEDFETLGATMAPYCLFGVVSYDAELVEPIRTAIANAAEGANSPEGEIYFIDSDRPKSSLDDAIDDFLLAEPKLAEGPLKAIGAAR